MGAPARAVWLVFLAFALFWGAQTRRGPTSWNETSRLAAVSSLVERGTHRIDDSPFSQQTKDKIFLGGHYYCDKPPLFQVLSAVPYAVLHRGLGMTLEPSPSDPEPSAYFWLTLLVVGLPSAGCLALYFLAVSRALRRTGPALALTGLLAVGTMMWPYSIVFNNHVAAGAALLASFVLASGASPTPSRARLLLAGLLAGLAVSFDLLTVFPVAGLSIVVLLRRRGDALAFAAACTLPLLATVIADYQISGSPLPPYFSRAYEYPGTALPNTVGGLVAPRSLAVYTLQGLVGTHGLLAASPVLLFALVGLARLARQRRHPLWLEGLGIGLGVTAFAVYVFTRTDVHGGKAYGERYFLSLVPLVAYFAVFALSPGSKRRWPWAALAVALPLSVVSAWQGSRRPWSVTPPVVYLDARPPWTSLGICSSLARADHPCLRLGRRGR